MPRDNYLNEQNKGNMSVFVHFESFSKEALIISLYQCFSTAGPRPSTGPWRQLYRVARDSPGIDN